jgi:hypothetical protein
MESMRAHFQREPESEWTGYNSSLERPLLNSKRFLEKMKAANGSAEAPADEKIQPSVSAAVGEEK